MNVLIVLAHPRRDSFCAAITAEFAAGLTEAGHRAEIADLHDEGFDPVMTPADEPDWDDEHKRYSDAVLREQARIERAEALALVFPIWWWSMPAMLKGWIDRVWNNGWAYGSRKLPHRRAWLLATASSDRETYSRCRYEEAMHSQLLTGTMRYCGIEDCALHMFYDVMKGDTQRAAHLLRARDLGRHFGDGIGN